MELKKLIKKKKKKNKEKQKHKSKAHVDFMLFSYVYIRVQTTFSILAIDFEPALKRMKQNQMHVLKTYFNFRFFLFFF